MCKAHQRSSPQLLQVLVWELVYAKAARDLLVFPPPCIMNANLAWDHHQIQGWGQNFDPLPFFTSWARPLKFCVLDVNKLVIAHACIPQRLLPQSESFLYVFVCSAPKGIHACLGTKVF